MASGSTSASTTVTHQSPPMPPRTVRQPTSTATIAQQGPSGATHGSRTPPAPQNDVRANILKKIRRGARIEAWLGSLLGIGALVVAIYYGIHTLKLSQWMARNDFWSLCHEAMADNITSPACVDALKEPPPPPPAIRSTPDMLPSGKSSTYYSDIDPSMIRQEYESTYHLERTAPISDVIFWFLFFLAANLFVSPICFVSYFLIKLIVVWFIFIAGLMFDGSMIICRAIPGLRWIPARVVPFLVKWMLVIWIKIRFIILTSKLQRIASQLLELQLFKAWSDEMFFTLLLPMSSWIITGIGLYSNSRWIATESYAPAFVKGYMLSILPSSLAACYIKVKPYGFNFAWLSSYILHVIDYCGGIFKQYSRWRRFAKRRANKEFTFTEADTSGFERKWAAPSVIIERNNRNGRGKAFFQV